jgi:hypothetical protein
MRRGCEETLRVLRAAKASLLTIVEVFIHDPLYKWALTPADARARQPPGAGSPGVRAPPAPPAPALPELGVAVLSARARGRGSAGARARPLASSCVLLPPGWAGSSQVTLCTRCSVVRRRRGSQKQSAGRVTQAWARRLPGRRSTPRNRANGWRPQRRNRAMQSPATGGRGRWQRGRKASAVRPGRQLR